MRKLDLGILFLCCIVIAGVATGLSILGNEKAENLPMDTLSSTMKSYNSFEYFVTHSWYLLPEREERSWYKGRREIHAWNFEFACLILGQFHYDIYLAYINHDGRASVTPPPGPDYWAAARIDSVHETPEAVRTYCLN